jgi:hypothetical protein
MDAAQQRIVNHGVEQNRASGKIRCRRCSFWTYDSLGGWALAVAHVVANQFVVARRD